MTKLIPSNTKIPASEEQIFSTFADNQTAVTIQIFEGERAMSRHNRLLGQFTLDGIVPAPRGVPQIKVKFDVDANGMLTVTATDAAQGNKKSIQVTSNSDNLTKEDIEKMKEEAAKYEEADKKETQRIQAKNGLDDLAYTIKRSANDPKMADKLSQEDKDKLIAASEEAIRFSQQNPNLEAEEYNAKKQELEEVARLFQNMQEHSYPTDSTGDVEMPDVVPAETKSVPIVEDID
mmetsp:Transcript_30016/g.33517  ORF Transcript_30016/g.33517 Transcript_30016/m.33517 type:complete len:234 (+) Transcript_30016:283-984(+)